MAAAHLGGRVLVLTVDPARRLANALGLEQLRQRRDPRCRRWPSPTPASSPGASCGPPCSTPRPAGTTSSASTPRTSQTRDAILANPLYQNITGKFVQSHDYIAMERLYEIHSSGRYDLIVVDTPPTRNAIDFLEAPERMADFFSSRLLRWLTAPARSRVVNFASKPFYTVADRILGSQFLEDIAEFFLLFQTMYDGFVERSQAVERDCSRTGGTTFVVVSHAGAGAGAGGGVLHRRARPSASFHLGGAGAQQGAARALLDEGAAEVGRPPLPGRRRGSPRPSATAAGPRRRSAGC